MTTMDTKQQTVTVGYAATVVTFEAPVHEFSGVQVIVAPNGKVFEPCDRCGGFTGCIPTYAFILAGVCFKCHGGGVGKAHNSLEAAERNLASRLKRREAAERRRIAKAAEDMLRAEEEFTAWAAVNPDLTETLPGLADRWAPIINGDYGYSDYPDERVDGWLRDAAIRVRNRQVPKHPDAIADLLAEYLAACEAKAATVYAAPIGDQIKVTGEVTVALPIEGQWGSSIMLILTAGPVTLKCYTTAKWAWAAERGDILTLTGTVKDHAEYDGTKQTVLARPKAVTA